MNASRVSSTRLNDLHALSHLFFYLQALKVGITSVLQVKIEA